MTSTDHPKATSLEDKPGCLIGYARVSTLDQDPALQPDALEAAGCERIFTDHASGTIAERPELARALDHSDAATCSSCGGSIDSVGASSA